MEKAFITIGGKTYRVEVNWNALANFLTLIGEDNIAGLARLDEFRVSHIPALIAATIEEGERLEGREVKLDDSQPPPSAEVYGYLYRTQPHMDGR